MNSTSNPATASEARVTSGLTACPLCGQLHTRIALRPGEASKCVRCDTLLAQGRASSWIVTLAWVITALLLWIPANVLPIVAVSQLGNQQESLLISGAQKLWQQDMGWVAALVVVCGIVAPLVLLLALLATLVPIALGRPTSKLRFLLGWLRTFQLWSIPEVHLLAVAVAFIKLGSLVRAEPAAGLWCYSAMSLAMLIAWRRFDVNAAAEALATERLDQPVT